MRPILALTLAAICTGAAAVPALAQADRYGGYGTYAQPQQQAVPAAPARVLSWPGKAIPAAAPPQGGGYGYPRYVQAQPAYGAQLQPAPYAQGRGAPPTPYQVERRATMYPAPAQAAYYPPAPQGYAPQGYAPQGYAPQPYPPPPQQQQTAPPQQQAMRPTAAYPSQYQAQPYYAPAPGAPAPAPGSTATAPNGVYPNNTVPPQLAYPMAVPPQMAAPMVGPQQQQPLPTSIYGPPQGPQAYAPQAYAPQAQQPELNGSTGLSGQGRPNPTDPRQEQRVAMNTAAPVQTARLYSLHREFGMTPDPTPAPTAQGQTVELVSSIDSGGAPNPDADAADRPATRKITDSTGKTVTALRGPVASNPDN